MDKSKITLVNGPTLAPKYPTVSLADIPSGTVFRGQIGSSGPDDVFLKTTMQCICTGIRYLVLRLENGSLANRWTDSMIQPVNNFRVVDLTLTVHDRT